ncbi:uncharacterized mitochondrial protein AtMg00810-like [Solanum stenotomum]|uniref:uncharacterized mitochondrial protein AtMg00810-like n=1 Tax=Solanum stenotomum TaxID=172797 RepID=UPI0020D02B9D|nr:uncharacterized mitochondrial protein AtMg00810-like [Solanum stenotomum]
MVTVRSIMALAASKGSYIYQMDVHNAFLNGDLLEEGYMVIPSGFAKQGETHKHTENDIVVVLVYVDDLLITGSNQQLLCNTRLDIKKKFKMKDLGELKFFLGIEFSRSNKGILMSQRKYALELISESGLGGAKPTCTPLEMNQKLISVQYDEHINEGIAEGDNILTNTTKYQRLSHMNATLRVVRYIKEAPGLGLLMPAGDTSKLTAYCDSDWGACMETRKSVTGYLVKFGKGLISWKSKKHETVSRSSAKVEFRSMSACTIEITWLI